MHTQIFSSKNNKGQGPDGVTNELFFKIFRDDLKLPLLELLNYLCEREYINQNL